jgi:hypothetical protein
MASWGIISPKKTTSGRMSPLQEVHSQGMSSLVNLAAAAGSYARLQRMQ